MKCTELYKEINKLQIGFDKSYKALTQNRSIHKTKLKKHTETLGKCFNEARKLIYGQRKQLNKDHWSQVF